MKGINFTRELVFLPVMILPMVYIVYMWPQLPERVPIHFDLHGTANGWGSRWTVWLEPGITVLIYLVTLFLPLIDPKRINHPDFSSLFFKIRLVVIGFLSAMAIFSTQAAVNGSMDQHLSRYFPVLLFGFFALLGNFMPNLKPNWFIGVRTPWTLSSDSVWKQTHQIMGRLWFYGGLLSVILCILIPAQWALIWLMIFVGATSIFAFAYSFVLYRREKAATAD
jgi:uncharacterized membrane protein